MNPTNPQEDNNPGVVASLVEKIEAKESGHPTTNPRFKTTSLYDANGFRIKRQQMDAKETTPSEQVGQAIKGVSNEITIADEVAQGAKYVIDGNLRRVPPYYFTYLTFCKERWRDRNIFELFTSEFRDRDAAYYKQAIERGQVTVNKKVANLDTIIRNGDQISHRTHKHEPPVTSSDIRIVFEDDELCVIDKPSGMPVHPTGRYRFNSVVQILKHEQNKNVHRHPIANDPVYSNEWVWGPELGKNGAGDDEAIAERLGHIGRSRPAGTWINPVIEESDFKGEMLTGAKCEVCETDLFSDPSSNDLDLWLHALTYSANDKSWSYATPFPEWALEPNRRYMELALEEAKKCEGTETAFSVGALLVKDGEILSTGYSRELPGNTHAEQCALEKYYEKTGTREVPEGTVIYTTMEPCSERLSGNLPCTDRILDTNIQTVFVGVLEPDTFVANNVGKKKLTDAGVHYIHIPGYEEACLAAATKP
ncbi:hypothetical protein DV454_004762 [Geotrichum candidum]|nr:hypothetical protein DV454_004762 [Geotrichum candidum]